MGILRLFFSELSWDLIRTMSSLLSGVFVIGIMFGLWMSESSHPYARVLKGYWDLHIRHRKESQELSNFSRLIGLPFQFTSEREQGVISKAFQGMLGLMGHSSDMQSIQISR